MIRTAPYTVLAGGYDTVMEHVDYPGWVDYVEDLFQRHGGLPASIIELGCGTGKFAILYRSRHPIRYLATDGSSQMIRSAKILASKSESKIDIQHSEFNDIQIDESFEACVLLFDGLNYLLDDQDVDSLLTRVETVLDPGGRFIFDQSTPANSINQSKHFQDKGECDAYRYVRTSSYDAVTRLHTTVFELETVDGRFVETHLQRAYEYEEVRVILDRNGFEMLAACDGFSRQPASRDSERIHWLVRKS